MTALVPPVKHLATLQAGHDLVQHEVLPQRSEILLPQLLPASVVARKAGVEAVDLRGGDDLRGSASAERPDNVRYEHGLQDSQVVRDRGTADLARTRKPSGLEDASALSQDQFSEFQERVPPTQAEQLLDVFGPVGVHPFLEVSLRELFRQKKRRQPAAYEPVLQIRQLGVLEVGKTHGGRVSQRSRLRPA